MTIDKPGIYDAIPMVEYHGQLTVGPSISSSGLRSIELDSPAHYYMTSYLNPEREDVSSPSLNFGSAAHALLIGEEHFNDHFVISPYDDFRSREARDWRDGESRTIIKPADLVKIQKMRAVLENDPLIAAGLLQGEIEKTIVWQDKETGVWLKARPDVLPHDDWAVDYKTAGRIRRRDLERSIMDYGYHMQMALVAEGLEAVGRPVPTRFVLLFQLSSPPYSVMPVSLGWELVRFGAMQNRRALRTFAECLEKDEWPHPEQMLGDFFGPDWWLEYMQRQEDDTLLPKAPSWIERAKREEAA